MKKITKIRKYSKKGQNTYRFEKKSQNTCKFENRAKTFKNPRKKNQSTQKSEELKHKKI